MLIPDFKLDNDQPATCEVAVQDGNVIVNYVSSVPRGAWGHLSFTPEQADIFITALQEARKKAAKERN